MGNIPTPLRDAAGRIDLRSLDRAGLRGLVAGILPELEPTKIEAVALRIYKEVWQHGIVEIEQMETVRRALRERLAQRAYVATLSELRRIDSVDGAQKFLWRLHDGAVVESVLIPDGDRVTLCMSSQVGCAMGCTFCLTGDLGLIRHLHPGEIASQPLQVQASLPAGVRITNLVLMGMGEPVHNLGNLITALRVCLDDHALNYSHRRITVSTVGLVPQLGALAAALPVNLAVSLNATTEAQRARIMPITKRYSMSELLEACRCVPLPPGKRITFEYVMFEGFNDTLDDAERLRLLLREIPTKINLIPYNENPDRPRLRRPSAEVVKAFQHHLVSRGVSCSIRTTRGIDISAACGQLGKGALEAGGGAAGS
ncbi:MAG TPA: 23S rRNA (adenine(2503)-C(2))-methyltransferase RlmN [Deltaproteobacteria bacterium]|nr:23S rRNA (adenine(2503)-C(2))-methyltransferase RlmN [Deltaproteobacteria bacterium]